MSGLGPFGAVTFLGGIGVGCWIAVKASQTILKAYYFALFSLVGAGLTLVIAFARGGQAPHPAAWIAASLAFGGIAVAIRAKLVRALSIAAVLLASYWLVGQKQITGPQPSSKFPSAHGGKARGTTGG